MPHPPADNKQRMVAAILSPEDYAAVQAFSLKRKMSIAEMVRAGLSRLMEREMADVKPGRRWPSKPV